MLSRKRGTNGKCKKQCQAGYEIFNNNYDKRCNLDEKREPNGKFEKIKCPNNQKFFNGRCMTPVCGKDKKLNTKGECVKKPCKNG